MKANKQRGWDAPNPQRYIVQMKNLTSNEVYCDPDGAQKPVLQGNTLDVCRGECWGIVGTEAFEVELLLQIIGCVRPYGSGSCKLVERGMMRKKRRILPHVFFVGDAGMAVPNMSVLEYLMFATQHTKIPAKDRQIAFLELMLQSDCYAWCFAPIKALSAQERAVLSLMAASFSNALLYIFPFFYTDATPQLRGMLKAIAERVTGNRAALILGVCDPSLAESACTHAGFLLDGTLREAGSLSSVLRKWDRRDFILSADNPNALAQILKLRMPDIEVRQSRNGADVYHVGAEPVSQSALMSAMVDLPVESIRKSDKTLENAFLEAQHDLSDELV